MMVINLPSFALAMLIQQLLCFSSITTVHSLTIILNKEITTAAAAARSDEIEEEEESRALSYFLYTPNSKTTSKLWNEFCPIWPTAEKSFDVTITWTRTIVDSVKNAAGLMIRRMGPSPQNEQQLIEALSQFLTDFSDFCNDNIALSSGGGKQHYYKARIVSSRGKSATKCPQWHIDHVPVRWIQALKGPGCEFVKGRNGINWSAVNGLDDDALRIGVEHQNNLLVDSKVANIYSTREQEVALLVGNKWNDVAKDSDTILDPVVHRSPLNIQPWQNRLLLTQDIVLEAKEDTPPSP